MISLFLGKMLKKFESNCFFHRQPSNITLDSACNSDCKCSIKYYQPLCTEEDQKTFFSACHAGCAENQKDGEVRCCYDVPLLKCPHQKRDLYNFNFFIFFFLLLNCYIYVLF